MRSRRRPASTRSSACRTLHGEPRHRPFSRAAATIRLPTSKRTTIASRTCTSAIRRRDGSAANVGDGDLAGGRHPQSDSRQQVADRLHPGAGPHGIRFDGVGDESESRLHAKGVGVMRETLKTNPGNADGHAVRGDTLLGSGAVRRGDCRIPGGRGDRSDVRTDACRNTFVRWAITRHQIRSELLAPPSLLITRHRQDSARSTLPVELIETDLTELAS